MPRIQVPSTGGSSTPVGSLSQINGMIGQTFDLSFAGVSASGLTGGQRQYVRIPVERAGVMDNVYVEVGTAGVDGGALLANCFVGIHNSAGTLVATTADQTANWKSTGVKEIALTVVGGQSLTVDPAVDLYLTAQLLIGTQSSTAVQLMKGTNAASRANVGLTAPDFRYATASGALSALSSTLTGVISQGGNAWYVGVGSTT